MILSLDACFCRRYREYNLRLDYLLSIADCGNLFSISLLHIFNSEKRGYSRTREAWMTYLAGPDEPVLNRFEGPGADGQGMSHMSPSISSPCRQARTRPWDPGGRIKNPPDDLTFSILPSPLLIVLIGLPYVYRPLFVTDS